MEVNFYALILSALSSLVIGMIWYNPKVFGTIWMREAGDKPNPDKTPSIIKMLAGTFVYAFLISMVLQFLVIHQFGAVGMIGGDPSKALPSYVTFMNDYGTHFRTFKHGMLHGFMAGLFFALPVIGIGALYENRSFKYTMVAGGYWIVTCMIMGGIICAWK